MLVEVKPPTGLSIAEPDLLDHHSFHQLHPPDGEFGITKTSSPSGSIICDWMIYDSGHSCNMKALLAPLLATTRGRGFCYTLPISCWAMRWLYCPAEMISPEEADTNCAVTYYVYRQDNFSRWGGEGGGSSSNNKGILYNRGTAHDKAWRSEFHPLNPNHVDRFSAVFSASSFITGFHIVNFHSPST